MKDQFLAYIKNLQDTITSKLEEVDGKALFKEDVWTRPEGGGGRTRVIENGAIFEKGGCKHFSCSRDITRIDARVF